MEKYLSIIIPCYNAEPYINELLDCLNPQITDEVEVIIVDDGSEKPFKTDYKWATVIRQKNGGASAARNVGIDRSKSQYLAFIDADDLVSDKYIDSIIKTAKTDKFDYCYLSWKTMGSGWSHEVKLKSIEDKFPPFNLCVWNRVYKRAMIGDVRFNTKKLIAEDAEFIRAVKEEGKKKSFIPEFMYYYRSSTPNSLTKRFHDGKLNTRRVVYYFPQVTSGMTFLLDEFKQLDKDAEIILLTYKNDIPELENYAMVMQPVRICGTELRGYPTKFFSKVYLPVNVDICIWTEKTYEIGGIETFIYNFCKTMSKHYSILVLYREMDKMQIARLKEFVRVEQNNLPSVVECNTLIVNRISDKEPKNVNYKQKVQMVHTCKLVDTWDVPDDCDIQVAVSDVAKRSFDLDCEVINNLVAPQKKDRALVLVSATRMSTFEKGQKRMIALSNLLRDKHIPYIWLCFSDSTVSGASGITFMKPTLNIAPYITIADYLVQLSDQESFCYSIVEALELGTPVLTTPLDVLPEIGFVDGKTGYIVPFDIDEKFDVRKIHDKQLKGLFTYKYDNNKRVKQWKEILGEGNPVKLTKEKPSMLKIQALLDYKDLELNRLITKGTVIEVRNTRAYELMQKNFVKLVTGDE